MEAADDNKVNALPLYLAVMSRSAKAAKEIIDKCKDDASYAWPGEEDRISKNKPAVVVKWTSRSNRPLVPT
ncbi:unnamed protein product [Urochloa humidicola]